MISPDVLRPAVRSMYTADQHEVYPLQPSSKMKINWYCLFTYTRSGISQPYVENLRHWELKRVDRKTHNDRWWFGMLYPPVNKVTTSPTAIQSHEYDNTGYAKSSVLGIGTWCWAQGENFQWMRMRAGKTYESLPRRQGGKRQEARGL